MLVSGYSYTITKGALVGACSYQLPVVKERL